MRCIMSDPAIFMGSSCNMSSIIITVDSLHCDTNRSVLRGAGCIEMASRFNTHMLPAFCISALLAIVLATFGESAKAVGATSSGWTAEAWTADYTPYTEARERIDKEVKESADPASVVTKYRDKAHSIGASAYAVFCWAVAAYDAEPFAKSNKEIDSIAAGVAAALASQSSSMHNYEYARMRYLSTVEGNWQDPDLKRMSARLLAKNPRDADVLQEAAASCRSVKESVALLDDASAITPNSVNLCSAYAIVYLDSFFYGLGNFDDGSRAVVYLRKFLSLHPPNVDDIRWAEHELHETERILARPRPKK